MLYTVTTVPAVAVPDPLVPCAAASVKPDGSGFVPVTNTTAPPPALYDTDADPPDPPAPPGW